MTSHTYRLASVRFKKKVLSGPQIGETIERTVKMGSPVVANQFVDRTMKVPEGVDCKLKVLCRVYELELSVREITLDQDDKGTTTISNVDKILRHEILEV